MATLTTVTSRPSITKDSTSIKEALRGRLDELSLTFSAVSEDARKRRMPIAIESISRYFSAEKKPRSLSEEHIVWLCCRYNIPVILVVGKISLKAGRLTTTIPPYSEEAAMKLLDRFFPPARRSKKKKK